MKTVETSHKGGQARQGGAEPRGVLLAALLIAGMVLAPFTPAPARAAAPPLAATFYGTVRLNGAFVPPGSEITAVIDGRTVAASQSFLDAGQSVFVIDLPGDDPDTPAVQEGGVENQLVHFFVAGKPSTPSGIWRYGVQARLDLSAYDDPLIPAFSVNPASPVVGQATAFTEQTFAIDAVAAWDWDFGDGAVASVKNPSHTYLAHGVYTVTLTVVDNAGRTDSVSQPIHVRALPLVDWSYAPALPRAGQPITFTDLTVDLDGTPVAWLWSFASNRTSTAQHPVYTYTAAGTYNVRLTVTDDDGGAAFLQRSVRVAGAVAANFDYTPTLALVNQPVAFTDRSDSINGVLNSWAWAFGDGATSTAQHPQHTYTRIGTFAARLTVRDSRNQSDALTRSILVTALPTATFSYAPPLPSTGEAVQFIDQSVHADASAQIVARRWDFGDGSGDDVRHPLHVYASGGAFTVTLTVTDSRGLSSATSQPITVEGAGAGLSVDFAAAKQVNAAQFEDGAQVVAASSVQNTDNRAENAFDFNDASAWCAADGLVSSQWIKLQLGGKGVHVIDTVRLRGSASGVGVKDFLVRVSTTGTADDNFQTVFSGQVPRDNLTRAFTFAPVAARFVQVVLLNGWGPANNLCLYDFDALTRSRQGGIVSLANGPRARVVAFSSQDPAHPARNAIDSSEGTHWQSARGQVTDQWLRVEIPGGGRVIDRVQFSNNLSNTGVRDFEIRVSSTISDAAAFTTVFAGAAPNPTGLQTFSFPPVFARYVEIFVKNNYGNTSAIRISTLRFLAPDGQNVSLGDGYGVGAYLAAASSQDGARPAVGAIDFAANTHWQTPNDRRTNQWLTVGLVEGKTHRIHLVKLRGGDANKSPKTFQIRASTATLSDTDFVLVFAGVLPNDGKDHWFAFPPVAARYVQLFVADNYGARAIQVHDFQVYAPDAGGAAVPFDNRSQVHGAAITQALWEFGDGQSSTALHPVHTYAAPGVYTVTLTAHTSDGQQGTARHSYEVLPPPAVDFTWTPPDPAEAQPVQFTGAGVGEDDPVLQYRWNFAGLGSNNSSATPAFAFPDNGDLPVTLTVLDTAFVETPITRIVPVRNVPPTVDIGPDVLYRRIGEAIRLPAAGFVTVNDVSAIDKANLFYRWTTGDGRSFVGTAIDFNYTVSGAYSLTLTVTDPQGAAASDSLTVQVYDDFLPPTSSASLAGSRPVLFDERQPAVSHAGAGAQILYADQISDGPAIYALTRLESGDVFWQAPSRSGITNTLTVMLPFSRTYTVDRVRLRPRVSGSVAQLRTRVKNFEVWVSDRGPGVHDFVRVLSATAAYNGSLQEFVFPGGPVQAAYVKLVLLDNYRLPEDTAPAARVIAVQQFQVVADAPIGPGGVIAVSSSANGAGPERLIDRTSLSGWQTANGSNREQWVKFLLEGGATHPIHAVTIHPPRSTNAPRSFEILVSTTTDDDAAFTSVYQGSVLNNNTAQDFVFPEVAAKYVKLLIHDNHGGAAIGITEFQVHAATPVAADGWLPGARVELAAQDNFGGAGVAKIEYSLNAGASWLPYGGPFLRYAQGSIQLLTRATDQVGNLETPRAAAVLPVDPSLKWDRYQAGQFGIDWLTLAASHWSGREQCVACHVQGDALHALALGSATGYTIDRTRVDGLVHFMTRPDNQRPSDGLWIKNADVTINSAHSLFGLALYDRYVSPIAATNVISGVNGMLRRQQPNGRWAIDQNRPPTNQGDIEPTVFMIFALKQAQQRVDAATAATYQAALDRAVNWLLGVNHAMSATGYNQDRSLKLIGLVESGIDRRDPRIGAIRDEILADQLADGGWREANKYAWSSAFATGQALYALCRAGVSRYDPQVVKGLDWLMHTQGAYFDNNATHPAYTWDGAWQLQNTGASARFASTLWPAIALACFGEVSFDLAASPPWQYVAPGQPAAQTLVYTLTIDNTGAEEDSFDLVVSGGLPGWQAQVAANPLAVGVDGRGAVQLLVTAPPDVLPGVSALYGVVAASRKNPAVVRHGQVSASAGQPPTSGHPTLTTFVAGDGEVHSSRATIRLAAQVLDRVENRIVVGPLGGAVSFQVNGVVVGSDTDADGDGIFAIDWTPGARAGLGRSDLRALYAGIDRAEPESDLLPSFRSGALTLQGMAQLTVSKDDGAVTVTPGSLLTYTVVVSNSGDAAAAGVRLTDTLPAGVGLVATDGVTATGLVAWAIGDLPAQAAVQRQVVVQVGAAAPFPAAITNTVAAAADGGLWAEAADVDALLLLPALSLAKHDAAASVAPGDLLTYTLTVTNSGHAAALGLILTDTLPLHLTPLSASGGGVISGTLVTWREPALAANATLVHTLTAAVAAALPADTTTLVNQAAVAAENAAPAQAADENEVILPAPTATPTTTPTATPTATPSATLTHSTRLVMAYSGSTVAAISRRICALCAFHDSQEPRMASTGSTREAASFHQAESGHRCRPARPVMEACVRPINVMVSAYSA